MTRSPPVTSDNQIQRGLVEEDGGRHRNLIFHLRSTDGTGILTIRLSSFDI